MNERIDKLGRELTEADLALPDEGQIEAQMRMQNLMWTVSGNYKLNTNLDLADWKKSKSVAMYDAVKQGAFDRLFDREFFALYMAKKIYLGADALGLQTIGQICVDEAVYPAIVRERPGVKDIRREAYEYLLEYKMSQYVNSLVGKIRLAQMKGALTGDYHCEGRIREPLEKVIALAGVTHAHHPSDGKCTCGMDMADAHRMHDGMSDACSCGDMSGHHHKHDHMHHAMMHTDPATMQIIRTVDDLYNKLLDPHYVERHGNLEQVLSVSVDQMRDFDWQDFMNEEADEDSMKAYLESLTQMLTQTALQSEQEEEPEEKKEQKHENGRKVTILDEEAVSKMGRFIELNFGKTYLSEAEEKRINYRLCRGAHQDCRLYFTDGLVEAPALHNAQYVTAGRVWRQNQEFLKTQASVVKRNIQVMTDYLKAAILARTQIDKEAAQYGDIVPSRLWKIGRTQDPGKLFDKKNKIRSTDFVVEVLLDASGSQRDRVGLLSMQALIISRALSQAHLPHRIMSYNTFWDYTVLQRYRDFDDPPEMDQRVLQMHAGNSNRDGLAIRAAGDALIQRDEENKVLIVLSDGKPNDVVVNRPGSHNPEPYFGDAAVRDTAHEVRALRGQGIYVLGVFTGKEAELQAEKKIFGKDFAYIRNLRNFSPVVVSYLDRLLNQE